MDRAEYKEKAKKKIEGKKWFLWKPLVMYNLTVFVLLFIILLVILIPMAISGAGEKAMTDVASTTGSILGGLLGFVEIVFMFGYAKYCLEFVRGKELDWREPIRYVKGHFVPTILLSLLVSLMICGGMILLVVPGIIIGLGHMFYQEVYVDNENLKTMELVSKSWALTNGHKMDLFVLCLSFIGWLFLVGLTLGILIIWVMPYMNITLLYVYEDLIKKDLKTSKK